MSENKISRCFVRLFVIMSLFVALIWSISITDGAINSPSITPTSIRSSTRTVTPAPTIRRTTSPTTSPTVSPFTTSLRNGSTGDDVSCLQARLNDLGFSVGVVDGSYGAKTEHAVKEFQKASGLSVDGVAGSKTQSALFSATAPTAPSSYRTYSSSSSNSNSVSAGNASNFNKYNEEVTADYVGNRNSGKFHRPSCSSAKKISPSNRRYFDSREAAINAGYDRCKRCNP